MSPFADTGLQLYVAKDGTYSFDKSSAVRSNKEFKPVVIDSSR